MKNLQVENVLPVITSNFDEVKEAVSQEIEKYKGIVVTEDTLQDCKKTRKEIDDLAKVVNDKKKQVKKAVNAPYIVFENQCKELISMIEDVKKPIDDGIKQLDNNRRIEKEVFAKEVIFKAIQEFELNDKYSKQLFLLDSYTKLSATKKFVVKDVEGKAKQLKFNQEQEFELEKLRQEQLERKVRDKIEKEKLQEQELPQTSEPKEEPKQVEEIKEVIEPLPFEPKEDERTAKISFEVTASESKVKELSEFLKANGYDYKQLSAEWI